MSTGNRTGPWPAFWRHQGLRSGPFPAQPQRDAWWPTVSIVILLVFSALLPPMVLTVMNGTLATIGVLVSLVTKRPIERHLWRVAVPMFLILLVGLVMGIGADPYIYFKDAWYVCNPVLVIVVGYILFINRPDVGRGLRAFILGGVLVAAWQLRAYFSEPELILLQADAIRRVVGTGHYAPVLALVILLVFAGRWGSMLKLPAWIGVGAFAMTAAAVGGVFSRTALLVVLIGLAAWVGCFAKREWLRLGLPVLALALVAFSLQLFVDVDSDRALKTFFGKLANMVHELSADERSSFRDININFRGHETAQAWNQYASGDILHLLFGRGFGSTVNLGVFLPLEGSEVVASVGAGYVTLLHNGYAYLLTKGGAVSVLLFLFVLGDLYFLARPHAVRPAPELRSRAGRLLQAVVVTLAATTYVIGGVFNKGDMFPFLLLAGFLIAFFGQVDE